MEGLEISIVTLKNINIEKYKGRFDPEFFNKKYYIYQNLVSKHSNDTIGNLCFLTDGEHGTIKTETEGDVKYYGARNVLSGILTDNGVEYITLQDHKRLSKSALKPYDVLISCVGANVGCAAVVPSYIGDANIVRNVALLRAKDARVNNKYLLSYFLTKYGKGLFVRMATGNAQPLVSLDYINTVSIPILQDSIQDKIQDVILSAEQILINANGVYSQAEKILLEELGSGFESRSDSGKVITAVKTLKNSFEDSGRLDAEYYQPKYDRLFEQVHKNAKYVKRLRELSIYNARGLQPIYDENGELDVINSKHILDKGLDYDNFEKTSIHNWDMQEKARVNKNDILTYTTGANIGRTSVYLSDNKALASNHVNILRLKEENPIYVAFVMNSIVGRLQTEQLSAGSAQQELYPKDIESFYIPFISKDKQSAIEDNFIQSLELGKQSKALLEAAKTAVEIAIEQNEEEAIKYLENLH